MVSSTGYLPVVTGRKYVDEIFNISYKLY